MFHFQSGSQGYFHGEALLMSLFILLSKFSVNSYLKSLNYLMKSFGNYLLKCVVFHKTLWFFLSCCQQKSVLHQGLMYISEQPRRQFFALWTIFHSRGQCCLNLNDAALEAKSNNQALLDFHYFFLSSEYNHKHLMLAPIAFVCIINITFQFLFRKETRFLLWMKKRIQ